MNLKFFIIIFIALLIVSCSKRDDPLIDAYLTKYVPYVGDTIWDRYVEVFDVNGLPMIPSVKLNDEEVVMEDYDLIQCIYYDTVHFATGQEYKLTVDHYYGQARAKINMPGEFTMLSPDPTYILGRDSVLTITWHKSDKASWYWFSLYLEYDYEDTADDWDVYEFYQDTILYDTIIQYPRRYFFPDYVVRILEGEAEAGTWALDGPNRYEPGTKGNIGGQGLGYFSANYQPRELDFYVGAPPKTPKLRNSSKIWDRLREKSRINKIKH